MELWKIILLIFVIFILLIILYKRTRENLDVLNITNPTIDQPLRNPKHQLPTFHSPNNTILTVYGTVDVSNLQELDKLTIPSEFIDNFNGWLELGILSPANSQKMCGACYCFATTGCLTDRINIATGGKWNPKFTLSPQYLVSCGPQIGMQYAGGCSGGIINTTFEALTNNGAPLDEEDSSSESGHTYYQTNENESSSCALDNSETCPCNLVENKFTKLSTNGSDKILYKADGEPHIYTIHSAGDDLKTIDLWPDIPADIIALNVERMKKAIYFEGPLAVGIKVTADFYSFRPTIDNYFKYDGNSVSEGGHAVVIIGWKKMSDGTPVWICRNSWGENWGYGFPDIKNSSGEIMYKGGFWNHIMGINDAFIESNASGPHPDLTVPQIESLLVKPVGKGWYSNNITLRDIYNQNSGNTPTPIPTPIPTPVPIPTPTPVPIPTPTPVPVPTPTPVPVPTPTPVPTPVPVPTPTPTPVPTPSSFNTKLKYSISKAADITIDQIQNFFNLPTSLYIISAPNNQTIQQIINNLPTTNKITGNDIDRITINIHQKINDNIVVGIKGSLGVYYYMINDTGNWSIFNLSSNVGRTTYTNVIAETLYDNIAMFPITSNVLFLSLN